MVILWQLSTIIFSRISLRWKTLAEVIVLGSGTGIPSLRRGSPGLLLLSDSAKILIDSGPGALRKMLEIGVTYRDIDMILYTHIHPDHISDLVPILFACKYAELPREKDVLVVGGPGFRSYFEKLENLYGQWIEAQSYELTIKEISQEPIFYRNLKVLSKAMAHISESVGYRIELNDGKSITISGDTDYCQNIVDLAFEVDLLVLECSFPDGRKVEGHLTPSLAGRIASESHCRKLMLYHLYPICEQYDILMQCKQAYQGEVLVAEDLIKVKI